MADESLRLGVSDSQRVAGGAPCPEEPRIPPSIAVMFTIPPTQPADSLGVPSASVELPRRLKSAPKNYVRPDALIVDDVMTMVAYFARVDGSLLEVACDNGAVVARGTLKSRQDKLLLEEVVANTLGVQTFRDAATPESRDVTSGEE